MPRQPRSRRPRLSAHATATDRQKMNRMLADLRIVRGELALLRERVDQLEHANHLHISRTAQIQQAVDESRQLLEAVRRKRRDTTLRTSSRSFAAAYSFRCLVSVVFRPKARRAVQPRRRLSDTVQTDIGGLAVIRFTQQHSWNCPACQTWIRHEHEPLPRPSVIYRCHVCRLELMLNTVTGKLALAPIEENA